MLAAVSQIYKPASEGVNVDLANAGKLPPEFVADIEHLQKLREEIASRARVIGERELEARVLRAEIEERLRSGVKDGAGVWVVTPIGKTEAEKAAKLDEAYLAFDRETIRLTYDRALAEAEAEGTRFEIQAAIALVGLAT